MTFADLLIPRYWRFDLSKNIEETLWKKTEEEYLTKGIEILKRAKSEIRGQWGEASLKGNNPRLEEEYKNAMKRGVDIVISTYKLKSRLLRELAKEGVIRVYKNSHRPDYHITVIDESTFVKEYHPSHEVKRVVVGVNALWNVSECLEEIEETFKTSKWIAPEEIDQEFTEVAEVWAMRND